ncbi:MAG: ABC transporter, substrate-binding protein (cluster 3, basic aa/glutamine/opines), partial [uncultured Solirubrobacteraceae bacterium]
EGNRERAVAAHAAARDRRGGRGLGLRRRPGHGRRRGGVHAGGGGQEVPGRQRARQDPAEGRDHDRREVRRPAVRLQEPADQRDRGLRHRPRQGGRGRAGRQAQAHRGDLRQPHPVPRGRHRRPDPLDDDHQRGARRADRVLRPVLHREGPDPRQGGLGHRRHRGPRGQEGLHRARLDLRGDDQEAGARRGPQARGLLLGVPRAHPERRGRRRLHRRRDPHRHDHPGRLAQAGRGRGAHAGAVRRRHQEGQLRAQDLRRRGLHEVQGGRPLEEDLRQVGRAVHEGGLRAADDRARRGREAHPV